MDIDIGGIIVSWIIILVLGLLVGATKCSQDFEPKDMQQLEKLCKHNEGLKDIYVYRNDYKIRCANGGEFVIPKRVEKL